MDYKEQELVHGTPESASAADRPTLHLVDTADHGKGILKMDKEKLEEMWRSAVSAAEPGQLEELATALVEEWKSEDPLFRRHMKNRLRQIRDRTQEEVGELDFDLRAARSVIADDVGFASWQELIGAIASDTGGRPLLFQYAIAAMVRGDFSALQSMVGGPEQFHYQITEWFEQGYFNDETETLAEVFTASCMLGHERTAAYLLDKGVDPLAGTKTGLNGFHYAASSGRLNIIKLLIERKVPMEAENMYGGTVVGQALWSAVNEYTADHAAIIEALIEARGKIEAGTLSWWSKQDVPSAEAKEHVANVLRKHGCT